MCSLTVAGVFRLSLGADLPAKTTTAKLRGQARTYEKHVQSITSTAQLKTSRFIAFYPLINRTKDALAGGVEHFDTHSVAE
jgi:hypothetical protein